MSGRPRLLAFLAAKHVALDCVLQRLYYLPRKDRPLGVDLHAHLLIVCAPYVLLRRYPHWLACLAAEYVTHGLIDCLKSRFRRRNAAYFARHAPAYVAMQLGDQCLHAAVLLANGCIMTRTPR